LQSDEQMKTLEYELNLGVNAQNSHYLLASEPNKFVPESLQEGEMILNIGPQHPSTHGVLRLEVVTDGEIVQEVVAHIGYLHRCFEKHAEKLPYNQIIPYVDRMDYIAAMNTEHAYAMGVERMLGIDHQLPKRVEYIRVLVAELNRIASHFIAIGTYSIDIGAFTPFLWLMRDREHILRLLEWLSGARMLYNYIWIGGLFYDLPLGFEQRCQEFAQYLKPKLTEATNLLIENKIFIQRTANVGVLQRDLAINYGVTGPMLRASGLRYDLRRVDAYSVYPELDFEIPIGEGKMGKIGDCWDRTWVRMQECWQSVKIIEQCLERLNTDYKRNKDFDPQAFVPKKIRPQAMDFYVRAENPKGETGFFFRTDGKTDVPFRCKARSASFSNLSVLSELCRGVLLADLIAIVGSLDLVMGEVDR
jgi:NADH-quinone oxidoreductase subunit D